MYSGYFASISCTAEKHYVENLKQFHLEDPFAIADKQWSENLSKWPDVKFGDVYTFLIDTKELYTKESLRAYKSLEAYNCYENGHFRTVYHLSTIVGTTVFSKPMLIQVRVHLVVIMKPGLPVKRMAQLKLEIDQTIENFTAMSVESQF